MFIKEEHPEGSWQNKNLLTGDLDSGRVFRGWKQKARRGFAGKKTFSGAVYRLKSVRNFF